MLHSEHIKQQIGIEMSSMLEIKLQKEHFLAKYYQFFNYCRVSFQTYVRMGK